MSDPGTITTGLGSSVTLAGIATVALGSVLGEDAVILGMGLIGTLLALSEQKHGSIRSSIGFLLKGLVLSYVFTGVLTLLAVKFLPEDSGLTPHTIVGVVAFLVGWTSNKWAKTKDWLWNVGFRAASKKIEGSDDKEEGSK